MKESIVTQDLTGSLDCGKRFVFRLKDKYKVPIPTDNLQILCQVREKTSEQTLIADVAVAKLADNFIQLNFPEEIPVGIYAYDVLIIDEAGMKARKIKGDYQVLGGITRLL